MNYDSYLARAIEIFNDKMDADFSRDNVILTCFMTDDQEEIFEQFCAQYFPYRLHDRYQEEGYFDFRASSFIGMDNGGKDGILLRTDIIMNWMGKAFMTNTVKAMRIPTRKTA